MNKNSDKHEKLTREQYRQKVARNSKLNVWDLALDRPYISVAIVVLALLFIMTGWWLGLVILVVISAIGIFFIARSKNPTQTLSIEFKVGGSRKLNMLKALQLGASMVMFLATYMRQVVTINFQGAGSADSLKIIQGAASQVNNAYASQGASLLNTLDNLMGGSLWGTYRYATNSAQFMNDSAGRWIMIWTFLLMVAPAICVLAQFFREPYSRRAMLVGSGVSVFLFILTPIVIRKWATQYALAHQINQNLIGQVFNIGYMAYPAILCSIVVFVISIYRTIKKDKF
ncbi:cytochrome C5 [uncultured Lactobacillus sp.]|uniref:cytochrome C5 n=1 Tax=uncultured Lactobacillus sp. TaxID=153152 RepID=UPI00261CFF67|nr:cytochrome C5 [uncultured Lactobacillus sp.]